MLFRSRRTPMLKSTNRLIMTAFNRPALLICSSMVASSKFARSDRSRVRRCSRRSVSNFVGSSFSKKEKTASSTAERMEVSSDLSNARISSSFLVTSSGSSRANWLSNSVWIASLLACRFLSVNDRRKSSTSLSNSMRWRRVVVEESVPGS